MVCTECGKTYNDKMAICPFCNAKKDESLGLEILDFDEILELEEDSEENTEEDVLEFEEVEEFLDFEEVEELDIVEISESVQDTTQDKHQDGMTDKYKSFSDLDDMSSYERVEIKVDRKQYAQNQIMLDTDDILYTFKTDKRRIKIMACLFIALVGSFFNFWSVVANNLSEYSDVNQKMGAIFGEGGALGSICVLLLLAAMTLTVINLTKYALISTIAAGFTIVLYALVGVLSVFSENFLYADQVKFIYPDLGCIIMVPALIAAMIFYYRTPEKIAEKKALAKEREISAEQLLQEAVEEQKEDIQKQKDKMQRLEDKRAAKESAKLEAKSKKNKKKKQKDSESELELDSEVLEFEEVDDDK